MKKGASTSKKTSQSDLKISVTDVKRRVRRKVLTDQTNLVLPSTTRDKEMGENITSYVNVLDDDLDNKPSSPERRTRNMITPVSCENSIPSVNTSHKNEAINVKHNLRDRKCDVVNQVSKIAEHRSSFIEHSNKKVLTEKCLNDKKESPFESIENKLEHDNKRHHIPIYKTYRRSGNRQSLITEKEKCYDFPLNDSENNPTGKKYKKTQKVRKRARIHVKHRGTVQPKSDTKQMNCNDNLGKELSHCYQENNDVQNGACSLRQFRDVDDNLVVIPAESSKVISEDEKFDFLGFSDTEDERNNQSKLLDISKEISRCYGIESSFKTPSKKVNKDNNSSIDIPIISFRSSLNNRSFNDTRDLFNRNLHQSKNSVNYSFESLSKFCSTPLRGNSFNCSLNDSVESSHLNVDNCFGFTENNDLEDWLVSPIKSNKKDRVILKAPLRLEVQNTPSVKDVIELLKDGQPDNDIPKIFSPVIDITEGMNKETDLEIEPNSSIIDMETTMNKKEIDKEISKIICDEPAQIQHTEVLRKQVPRRSYDRPVYARNVNKSFQEDTSEDEVEEKKRSRKKAVKKRRHGPTKKEEEELDKWAEMFNKQCNQVESFSLVIE